MWLILETCCLCGGGQDMIIRGHNKPLVPLDEFISVMKPYVVNLDQYAANCKHSSTAAHLVKKLSKLYGEQTFIKKSYRALKSVFVKHSFCLISYQRTLRCTSVHCHCRLGNRKGAQPIKAQPR